MAEIVLSQAEADALIAMQKVRADDTQWTYPRAGEHLSVPLTSADKRELFSLDITRSRIKLTKSTHQNRARHAIVLLRLDIDGAPHRNPDPVSASSHLPRRVRGQVGLTSAGASVRPQC